jgi:16S rRNA (guanine966-N2)-methyltransferase
VRLRLVAGEWGGRTLSYPRGVEIRPTAEAVREAVFSGLARELPGARFADLFAGTGAMGLEALSRGAALAISMEKQVRCVEAIRTNAANLGAGERLVVIAGPVERRWPEVAAKYGPFDIVFADPPYAYGGWEQLLAMLLTERVGLAESGIVIAEHARRTPLPAEFVADREKLFGETALTYYRAQQSGGEG